MLPLVEFVEQERELSFEHPVQVDFLDEDEWEEHRDIDEEELDDDEAELIENLEAMFRAFGLVEGDFDLLADMEDLGTSGTVGSYAFDDEVIRVRGDSLTAETKSTLVHELTHALQDQHFDIGDRMQESEDDDDAPDDSLSALAEGDADRIEERWEDELTASERDELDEEQSGTDDSTSDAIDELPTALVTFFASDYVLGDDFVSILVATDDNDAVDDAFRSPPGPEEHLVNPFSYLDGDGRTEVELPRVDGEPIEDVDGEFGSVTWLLMLAERTDPVAALTAVDGWGGDSFRAYVEADRTCVAARFVGEDADATTTMEDALSTWIAAMPSEADAAVERDGDTVELVTCDPGPDADVLDGDGRSRDVISLVSLRSSLAIDALADGDATTEQAGCFSQGFIANLPYELIVSDELTSAQQEQVAQVGSEQVERCR